jgi:cytochrome c553
MSGKNKTPHYAVRLVVLIVLAGTIFFVGLRFFVPEGSKLTGSYDAESLLYIASAPVEYAGSKSCGASGCHESLFKKWSDGAHGAREEQSKCEACHGPQGKHPEKGNKLPKVRGDGNVVELCLTCHRKMKARSTTGQPQIAPQEHPFPHKEVLICTQCHNPHSPGFNKTVGKPASSSVSSPANSQESATDKKSTTTDGASNGESTAAALASGCFSCHGPKGRGGFAPVLAGQPYEALKDKLNKFRSGELKGTMMNPVASKMKDKEINALAHYFNELP